MKIDWALLRSQKLTLLHVIDLSPPTVAEDLTGILQILDALQDEAAANSEIGIKEVFGEY
jgi:hypothetical protein